MSKWLGFFVGLAIAVTVVMTVVRPAPEAPTATRETDAADGSSREAREVAAALAELVARTERSAGEGAARRAPAPPPDNPPSGSAAPTVTGAVADPVPPPAAADAAPAPDAAPASPPAVEAPAVEAPAAARHADPIPEFRWRDAPAPPGTQVTPLPPERIHLSAAVPASAVRPAPAAPAPPAAAPLSAPPVGAAPPATEVVTPPPVPASRQWYAFWRPFTSELSAKGFSDRLERVTGLDYRVVKVESGAYHVAFGYDDEQSRLANLSTIEAATGLRLAGGRL